MNETRHDDKNAVMPLVRKSDDHTYKQALGKAYLFIFGMMEPVHTSVQSPSNCSASEFKRVLLISYKEHEKHFKCKKSMKNNDLQTHHKRVIYLATRAIIFPVNLSETPMRD